jgi:oligopeptide/dipeptide ABC transporter ATP-binding protein
MSAAPLLEVEALTKRFPQQRTLVEIVTGHSRAPIKAVDGVSFTVGRGEVLALVGESGCGKTTVARMLIGLETPTSGQIRFAGQALGRAGADLKAIRRRMQMVFQDPYESLNPRATIDEIVAEPLEVHQLATGPARRAAVEVALESAGLRPAGDFLPRRPHELSGGQRQRVVIAAALALEPELIVADEPVSMLDVSIRAELLNLLADLRQTRGISLVFITHDLSTVAYFADRVAVMYLGRIVEIGPTADVLSRPQHPYTQALRSVVPAVRPDPARQRLILSGEAPNPAAIPAGCRFHTRCPLAEPRCRTHDPALTAVAADWQAACVLVGPAAPLRFQVFG